ncbi:hypothetical protein Tco_0064332 [Tanacetum coccineum]
METKDTLPSCSNSEEQQMQQIQDKAKKSCTVSFRQLHSHLKLLSNNDLKETRTECGFKRAFATLFHQDVESFTGTMILNVDQLEKQLDKEEFQEIGSMTAFKYFLEYTQLKIPKFCDTLIQHMESVKKSIEQMQIIEEKVDTSNALDASLVNTKSSRTESGEQDTSSRSGNDEHADDADIIPIYDEEPMAEVQLIADHNVFATGQQHTEQPEFNDEGESQVLNEKSNEAKVKHDIDVIETINIELEHKVATLLKENETLKRHYKELYDSIKTTRAKTIEHTTSLIAKNDEFKAQLQEKGFAIAALKNELRKLTGNSVNTKFAKSSILGKSPRFASQADVNNDLSKPVTTHYLPKERESAIVKPHHVIASSDSRNSSKNMLRFSSNDMVHNHYLEEAKKKTQERGRNSKPSVMPSARSQSTTNDCKPKPKIDNRKSRNWPASKSSCVTTKTVPIAEHSKNSTNFSDSKHFVCSTCQKCVFNANHDHCVTKFLNEVNSRAKVPSNKTTNKNKPVEQTSFSKKPERQIPKGDRFSIKKTFVVHEKTMTLRSCLRWKPTGKIFKNVGLRWVPTGKIFTSSTTKVNSEPTNGSNEDITNQYECKQTLNVSAGTLNLSACTSFNPKKEGLKVCNEPSSSKLVPKVVPPVDKIATSRQELELIFHHHITMLRLYNGGGVPFQLKSDSLPHAHAQTTKTYYKHQDSRTMKAQKLKTKTSANSDIKDNSSETKLQGRLLASFQDDAKYEHVGQDTRLQGGKDYQD